MQKLIIYQVTLLYSLCKKTANTALLSFLKQSFTYVNSLISKTSKALSLPFSYQRLKTRGFLAGTIYLVFSLSKTQLQSVSNRHVIEYMF